MDPLEHKKSDPQENRPAYPSFTRELLENTLATNPQVVSESVLRNLIVNNPNLIEPIVRSVIIDQIIREQDQSLIRPFILEQLKSNIVSTTLNEWASNSERVNTWIEGIDFSQGSRVIQDQLRRIIKDDNLLESHLRPIVWNALDYLIRNGKLPDKKQLDLHERLSLADRQLISDGVPTIVEVMQTQIDQLKDQLSRQQQDLDRILSTVGTSSLQSIQPALMESKSTEMAASKLQPRLAAKMAKLQPSRPLYYRYLQDHDVPVGSWISILNHDYQTAKHFPTYQAAAESNRGRSTVYCKEYRGLQPPSNKVCRVATGSFGAGRHPYLASIGTQIGKPLSPLTDFLDIDMMVDTGATVSMGRYSILLDNLDLEPLDDEIEEVRGIGNVPIEMVHLAAEVQVDRLPLICIDIMCPIEAGHDDPEGWILGQNFLKLCDQKWTSITNVELEYPSRILSANPDRCCSIS